MKSYHDLLRTVMETGTYRDDRTGTGTYSLFGAQARFSLEPDFPLLTTKKLHLRSIIHELLWFIQGNTNIGYLKENKVRIWDEWADESGNLGRVYGAQWRGGGGPRRAPGGQPGEGIESPQKKPHRPRHMVCAWNPGEVKDMALPPCHALFQFYVAKGELSCQLYQRSADIFLGVPFNIASYALLTMMIAQVCGLKAKEFVHTFGDLHLYSNHVEQAKEQLSRAPRALPQMKISPRVKDINDFKFEDLEVMYPKIRLEEEGVQVDVIGVHPKGIKYTGTSLDDI